MGAGGYWQNMTGKGGWKLVLAMAQRHHYAGIERYKRTGDKSRKKSPDEHIVSSAKTELRSLTFAMRNLANRIKDGSHIDEWERNHKERKIIVLAVKEITVELAKFRAERDMVFESIADVTRFYMPELIEAGAELEKE